MAETVFIVAMVVFGVGALLLLIGIIKLCMWYCRAKESSKEERKKIKALEHVRHLEEYSVRTGGTASDYASPKGTPKSGKSAGSDSVFRYDDLTGVNPAYVSPGYDNRLPPGTYIRVIQTPEGSTGRRSPGGSLGYDQETSKMAGMSEVTVAHPMDRDGVARVMVGGSGMGGVPSTSPSTSLSTSPTTRNDTSRLVVTETRSQYSTTDRRQYGDVMF